MTAIDWPMLTRLPAKADFYRNDVYVRETLADLTDLYGDSLPEILWRSALLMVRPEGLRVGRLAAVLDLLDRHDFAVVAAEELIFDRFRAREMWRYQHTLASIDRIAATDQILIDNHSLVLLLRAREPADLPATVALSALKGPADPANRPPDTLRSVLDQSNLMFSMVHCADEPADLVRELGIAFDTKRRRTVLSALGRAELDAAGTARLATAMAQPVTGFEPSVALTRVRTALAADPATLELLDALTAGTPGTWRPLMHAVQRSDARVDPLDLAFVGACHIEYDEPGARKLLGGPDVEAWRRPASHAA